MRINCYFSGVLKGFKLRALPLTAVVLILLSWQALAYEVELETNGGGSIVTAENNFVCSEHCKTGTFSKKIVSLLAVPAQGYRFAGWDGDCKNQFGTLCTLKLNKEGKANATFIRSHSMPAPTQAVLFLHDIGEKYTVWNDYVSQRFNNDCPVIYGGVQLQQNSFAPQKTGAKCFRISFGYYDLLRAGLNTQMNLTGQASRNTRPSFSQAHLGYEIRAAVLNILNRYPEARLTLVSQGQSTLPAFSFLHSATEEFTHIRGLLALRPESGVKPRFQADRIEGVTAINLDASPEAVRTINAALGVLLNSR